MGHRYLCVAAATAVSVTTVPAFAQTRDVWSGPYVGANIGGTWGSTSNSTNSAPGGSAIVIPPADLAAIDRAGSSSSDDSGFTGGIELGYNYRIGDLLLGLETEYGAFDVNHSTSAIAVSSLPTTPPISFAVSQNLHTNWIWTLRPRVGYVYGPWMVYATGGLALTSANYQVSFSSTAAQQTTAALSTSDTKAGWTAGAGVGYAINPRWSVKGEYLYADFGSIGGTLSDPRGFVNLTSSAKITANILRVGVDYRF